MRLQAFAFAAISFLSLNTYADVEISDWLKGKKFVLENAICSEQPSEGMSFSKDGKTASYVVYYEEEGCTKYETRVKWLTSDIFALVENKKKPADTPPEAFFFKVESLSNNQISLKNMPLFLDESSDSTMNFKLKK